MIERDHTVVVWFRFRIFHIIHNKIRKHIPHCPWSLESNALRLIPTLTSSPLTPFHTQTPLSHTTRLPMTSIEHTVKRLCWSFQSYAEQENCEYIPSFGVSRPNVLPVHQPFHHWVLVSWPLEDSEVNEPNESFPVCCVTLPSYTKALSEDLHI